MAIDEDVVLKERAGINELNQYSNEYELQTLSSFLNEGAFKILDSDDTFCTKILLANLKKITFDAKYHKLKAKSK